MGSSPKAFQWLIACLACWSDMRRSGLTAALDLCGMMGKIVPGLDAAAVAGAVQRLLEDETLGVRLGQNLKERVMREHTIETIAPQIMRSMAKCAPEFTELQRWR